MCFRYASMSASLQTILVKSALNTDTIIYTIAILQVTMDIIIFLWRKQKDTLEM